MKTVYTILIGISLNIFGIWLIAFIRENGDWNSVLMYFTIYGILAIGIANGLYLKHLEDKKEKRFLLILYCLLPLIIFLGFIFSQIFRLTFIGEFGLIGIGLANLIWIYKFLFSKN